MNLKFAILLYQDLKNQITKYINLVLDDYGIVIASLIIGIFVGWYFKLLISDRKYNEQINIRLSEKDKRISELNFLIHERLNKIQVKEEDKSFFKKLKKFFKKFSFRNS